MTDEPTRIQPRTRTIVESVHPALIHAVNWADEHDVVEFMQTLAAFCAGWDARERQEAECES